MTTDEKLQHFLDICMEDARDRGARVFDEYAQALDKTLEEHKASARHRARMQIQGESEKIQREINKELALEQINLKRIINRRHDELKDKLFAEVQDLLDSYMKTPQYLELLDSQVRHATEFAGTDPLIIYMDPADEDKRGVLAQHYHANIKISDYSFGGGIRAVIPTRHILIDNSFGTKLAEAKRDFRYKTGGVTNG